MYMNVRNIVQLFPSLFLFLYFMRNIINCHLSIITVQIIVSVIIRENYYSYRMLCGQIAVLLFILKSWLFQYITLLENLFPCLVVSYSFGMWKLFLLSDKWNFNLMGDYELASSYLN